MLFSMVVFPTLVLSMSMAMLFFYCRRGAFLCCTLTENFVLRLRANAWEILAVHNSMLPPQISNRPLKLKTGVFESLSLKWPSRSQHI
jgi:hypothetical protein